MPGAGRAEVYFIAAMMILIMVVCVVAVVAIHNTVTNLALSPAYAG